MCAPHAAASAFTGATTYLYEHAYLCFHCRCENAAWMCVNGCVWIGGLPMRLLFKFRSFPRIPCLNGKSGRGMKARRKQSQNPARQHISAIRACGYLSNTSAIRKQSASSVYRNAPCYPAVANAVTGLGRAGWSAASFISWNKRSDEAGDTVEGKPQGLGKRMARSEFQRDTVVHNEIVWVFETRNKTRKLLTVVGFLLDLQNVLLWKVGIVYKSDCKTLLHGTSLFLQSVPNIMNKKLLNRFKRNQCHTILILKIQLKSLNSLNFNFWTEFHNNTTNPPEQMVMENVLSSQSCSIQNGNKAINFLYVCVCVYVTQLHSTTHLLAGKMGKPSIRANDQVSLWINHRRLMNRGMTRNDESCEYHTNSTNFTLLLCVCVCASVLFPGCG